MILAVLSDIHSNPWALEEVVVDARRRFGDQVHFCILGDLIGYGPFPLETIFLLQKLDNEGALFRDRQQNWPIVMPGNHEGIWLWLEGLPYVEKAFGKIDLIHSSEDRRARRSELIGRLYRRHLSENSENVMREPAFKALVLNMLAMRKEPDPREWYRGFFRPNATEELTAQDPNLNGWNLHLAHAKLTEPLTGELRAFQPDKVQAYINGICIANSSGRSIFLHGHTHVPMSFASDSNREREIVYGMRQQLDERIHLVNPGGVGMQRDYDTRPAYAVLELNADAGWVTFFRVDISEETKNKREKLLQTLNSNQYPKEVVKFFQYAPYFYNGDWKNGDISQELKDYLAILQKRAGDHWIDPEGVPE